MRLQARWCGIISLHARCSAAFHHSAGIDRLAALLQRRNSQTAARVARPARGADIAEFEFMSFANSVARIARRADGADGSEFDELPCVDSVARIAWSVEGAESFESRHMPHVDGGARIARTACGADDAGVI